ncbi:MAG: aminotransferase class I/II-fold pyridoxal phosphate-dependent enzyme [Deltaproteobacteria bacterium]|nr:aminotransferase class I/II-fold pyridoxal phosphate-dependent enzyme [Deltaproteobacteria bacterium]
MTGPDAKRIYLSPPHLDGREQEYLLRAFDSNWITTCGPQVDAFEQDICARTGIRHGVALASGTAALHLGLLILGVGPGDEVLCSTLTFAASANAIVYCGATPVFIDSDRETWTMDPRLLAEELERALRRDRRPKAVLVVDLYGQCADYGPIRETCSRYNLPVLEDAAEALGATYQGAAAGKFGALGVFSFNGNKIITTSGGGMLVSDNREYIDRARFLSTQARDPAPFYQHSHIGYNYRLSNLLAALGQAQLERLSEKILRKKAIQEQYRQALADLPGITFMPEAPYGCSNGWLTVLLIDPERFGSDREAVRLALEADRIESRPIWKPMHMQPVFDCSEGGSPISGSETGPGQGRVKSRAVGGPVSEDLFARGLCLPSGAQLTEEDLERIIAIIQRCRR